ncbi:hypothetical protein OSH11_15820 [Kaistia dalseonensis]|uniref:Uncharacterized protein n=1 Tax=Kaistia dalseonensis TaxID=410840 RepID=A0ABU0H9X4_9HYPH|nr:hypothetical protein [Kaistia dalseonensis]MCX5496180.1 hypothetical protein [Kaistia dalseonensis]MDQ0438792.1 hypothetical protein [Kaistia dalseonensis]
MLVREIAKELDAATAAYAAALDSGDDDGDVLVTLERAAAKEAAALALLAEAKAENVEEIAIKMRVYGGMRISQNWEGLCAQLLISAGRDAEALARRAS